MLGSRSKFIVPGRKEGDVVKNKPILAGKYSSIASDVHFGKHVKVYGYTNLYGCVLEDDCQIGAFVEIQKDVIIGKRARIQSHSFICSGIMIGDDAFIGHHVTFVNDRHPTAEKARNKRWRLERTTVGKGASIGSGSTILCGLTIGEKAVVGAGSVVVKDVPPGVTVVGNPARILKQKRSR